MKTIFYNFKSTATALLTLLVISNQAHSEQITLEYLNKYEGFDYRFVSSDIDDASKQIDLDCQSFFHKLDFYKDGVMTEENFISVDACHYLVDSITSCLETKGYKCIDSKNIFNEYCFCEND